MKIVQTQVKRIQELTLGHLTVGDTFMFIDYDLDTGPFLVINSRGYCKKLCKTHDDTKAFVLNLAENTICYRTVNAAVEIVNCAVAVGTDVE